MPRKKPSGEVAKNRYQPLGLLLILLGGVLAVGTVVAVPAQSLASNGIFNVTLSIAQGQGTVCYAGANSACTTSTVTGRFSDSEQVTFTAQNSVSPWVFDHWNLPCQPSQACVIYQNPYMVTIPFGTTISAVYVGGQVTVTTTGTKPALTINGPTSLPLGSTFSFTAGNMYQGDAFELRRVPIRQQPIDFSTLPRPSQQRRNVHGHRNHLGKRLHWKRVPTSPRQHESPVLEQHVHPNH